MTDKPARRVTITEVARQAGVSTATAGRVLGGYGYASPVIRDKIREIADTLGYRPNLLARGLITGRTQTIGVVTGDLESPFYASILRGITDVARSRGFGIIVSNSDEIYQREREAVKLLSEKQVDGLIVTPSDLDDPKHLRDVVAGGCPVVQIDRRVDGLHADSVTVDNVAAARASVEHLIAAGHRRIAMVAELERPVVGDLKSFVDRAPTAAIETASLYPSWQRLLGFVQAHRDAGLRLDMGLIRRVGAYSAAAAKEDALDLLRGEGRPTAVFTADGLMSGGVMEAVATLDLELPRDLSLVCFDDLDWMRFFKPSVTAVAQPLNELGRAAARLVLSRIEGDALPPQHLLFQAELRLRGSVSEPRHGPAPRRRHLGRD
jgi:LacI family transcriptional regulator